MPQYYTVSQAAKAIAMSETWLYRRLRTAPPDVAIRLGRSVRVDLDKLRLWLPTAKQ